MWHGCLQGRSENGTKPQSSIILSNTLPTQTNALQILKLLWDGFFELPSASKIILQTALRECTHNIELFLHILTVLLQCILWTITCSTRIKCQQHKLSTLFSVANSAHNYEWAEITRHNPATQQMGGSKKARRSIFSITSKRQTRTALHQHLLVAQLPNNQSSLEVAHSCNNRLKCA